MLVIERPCFFVVVVVFRISHHTVPIVDTILRLKETNHNNLFERASIRPIQSSSCDVRL